MTKPDYPQKAFATPAAFETWLAKNHAKADGLQLRLFKKDSGKKSLTYAEALDEALCYGWIDGQKRSLDAESWIQIFTPRRSRSIWSKKNQEHVARLIAQKRMRPAGQAVIDVAKADGRWERAYESPKNMTVPEDFLAAVKKHKQAAMTFASLNKANKYAIAWRLSTAKKPETRARRFAALLALMSAGKTLH